MAGRYDDGRGSSPLDGLGGGPRRGAHRTGAGGGALLSSLAAVVAVVLVLGGLYLAFGGRSGDDSGDTAGGDPAVAASADPSGTTGGSAASAAATPSASAPATAAATPTPTPTAASPSGTPSETPGVDAGAAGASTGPEDPGAGDEGGLRDLPVVVLNQSGRAGLASRTASTLRSLGWTVSSVGNFKGAVPSTTVYYPDGAEAAAQALAASLPGPDRVRPVFAGISSTKLTVILA